MNATVNLGDGLEPLPREVARGIEKSIEFISVMSVPAAISQTELVVNAVLKGHIQEPRDLVRGVLDHLVTVENQVMFDALEEVVLCAPEDLNVDEEDIRRWAEEGQEPDSIRNADGALVTEFFGNLMFHHGWGVAWIPEAPTHADVLDASNVVPFA